MKSFSGVLQCKQSISSFPYNLSLLALTCRTAALDLLHISRMGISLARQGHAATLARSLGVRERREGAGVARVSGARSMLHVWEDGSLFRTQFCLCFSSFPAPWKGAGRMCPQRHSPAILPGVLCDGANLPNAPVLVFGDPSFTVDVFMTC